MALDDALSALADPTRRKLVSELSMSERRAGDLADLFPVSRPAIAKHLRVLREAGLVTVEKIGRCQIYRLDPGGLNEIERWMQETSAMWDGALGSFKRYAETRSPSGKRKGERTNA